MVSRYTFGIEEEFFVVDGATGDSTRGLPPTFLTRCRDELGNRVELELLQSQIETQTVPHLSAASALDELVDLRGGLARAASGFGLNVLAAGTHPFATWRQQKYTERARYRMVMSDLGMIGYRNLLCGLHVHVAVPDPDNRVPLMTRSLPFLPLFLALSTSSPFWNGLTTGLYSYRLAAYDELPRTGLPPVLDTAAQYQSYIDALTASGIIPDASYIWWAIRPSLAHPTLELRIADACTHVADSVTIASLFRALVYRLDCDDTFGPVPSPVVRALAEENRWRIQRDGLDARLVGLDGSGTIVARDAVRDLATTLADDAAALGDPGMVEGVSRILDGGTSAHRQIDVYRTAREGHHHSRPDALAKVTRWLMRETTTEDLPVPRVGVLH